ncbi:hypothetical protein OS493_016426 [Desmophyllum pertusum]|uniref:TNFR-Cys domain-containing protein n=1 Tax=Desmophyllum pertusum TaxID=174260 RepID=A0A9X0D5A1_9CNID|nr:hypothetical protein OS493_016426 [Desmophyllum pertusum]
MTFSFSRMDIYRLVLLCSVPVLLVSQTASAGKSSRRFIGLPESGERVKYSDASDKNKTLIIRHNLPYEPSLPEPADTSETDKRLVIILSSVGLFAVLGLVVSALCYFCYWKKRRKPVLKKQAAKQLFEENATAESPTVSRAGRGGGTPGPSGTQFLVVAVCACALHAQLQTTNVEINVYFPKGFLRSDSKVFFKSENNNEVRVITNDTKLKINVFDVPNAGLVSENRCSDRNLTCANGACDPLAGKCVCPRKMRAIRQTGGGTRCVYRCDQKCQSGFFVLSSCNHTHQAVCKKCRPQCSFKEFESVPCAGKTDRNCTDISKLPQIKGSPNIIYEDILKVKDNPPVKQIIDNLSSHSTVWLNRSSGLAIQLQILLVDFSTTFREVNHVANDNSGLKNDTPSQSIVRDFCGSPVPDYYRINLQQSAVDVQIIKGQPNTPCPRYDGGSTSNIPVPGNSLSCNGAENPIVRLFGVKSETEDFWKEERSQACYDLKQNCHQCRNECTVLARENPICNLTKNDVRDDSRQNYGEHFTYCFDCCFQEKCTCLSCACSQYNSSCIDSQLTCVGAKHSTIPITPVFPNTGLFKCHVKLSKGPVFELETALWKDGKLLRRIERNDMNFSKEAGRGKNSYDYGYMIFKQPSVLRNNTRKNILINGKAGKSNFDVGWYKTEQELENPTPVNTLSIQPTEPFKINTKDWPSENCQTLDTEKFVTISPSASIDNVENFAQLTAQVAHEQNARVYKVYNNSGSRQVHFEVPSERSVLRYAFPETVIFNDRSFTGKLLKNRTFWTVRLTGHASSCPGFFVVRLTDQDRPDVDVYHYDIAITTEDCSFTVEFHLPSGGDTNFIDKQFVVRLTDSRKTMKLILVSPRRIPEFEIPDFDDDFDLKKLEVLIPFGGAAGGMFIVLIAILIYGYKTRPKDSYHRDRDNELHFRHILYVVWFVGMRLVKSFLLTLTVLFVILTAIHYTNVKTLEKYETLHEQRSKLEEEFIKQMDTHKVQEINRQWSLLGKESRDTEERGKKEEKKKKKEEKLKKKLEKKPRKKKDEDKDDGEDLEEANEEHRENYEGNGKETMEDTKEISGRTENATSRVKPKPHANEPGIASAGKNAPNISVDSAQDQESGHIKRVDNSDEKPNQMNPNPEKLNAIFLKFLIKLKQLNYQINNTNLVPMCILSVIGILSIYVVIVTTKHSMNVETLDVVGYFDLKMSPLLTMRKIVNTRITSNAFMVNDVHIPYYENRVNARIAFYRKKAKMYQAYQCSKSDLHNEEYCSWAEEPGTSCEGVGPYNQAFLGNLTQFECNLKPVIAQRFTKFDRIRYKEVHKKAIAPYVAAFRGLILNTFYMILIVIGIFILFQILGIVVFVLMKKFDLVRQVKHYQTNQDLKKELTLPHCIKYPSNESVVRRVGPLQMSEDMKDKFGPSVHDGKSIEWVK